MNVVRSHACLVHLNKLIWTRNKALICMPTGQVGWDVFLQQENLSLGGLALVKKPLRCLS